MPGLSTGHRQLTPLLGGLAVTSRSGRTGMSEAEVELTRPRAIVLADVFDATEPLSCVRTHVYGFRLPSMSQHGRGSLFWEANSLPGPERRTRAKQQGESW